MDYSDQYTYETKCRRCGKITEWHFASKDSMDEIKFIEAINNYIQYPRTYQCKRCNKATVQDVVSY